MVKDWMNLSWKMLLVRGALAIVFGIVAIAWPIETAVALALLWGVWALVDGISSVAQAFTPEGREGRFWLIAMGVIAVLAGIFAITSPGLTAVTLTWLLGIWLIVRAGFEAFAAFSSSTDAPRWLLVVGAVLSLAIGVLFVANPGSATVALALWLGILAIAWGVVFVIGGLEVRREMHSAGHGHPLPA